MTKFHIPPDQATYSVSNENDTVTSRLDGGLSRVRRDVEGAAVVIDVSWTMDRRDFQYFKAFYNTELVKGTLAFEIDLILNQPYLEEHSARFVANSLQTRAVRGNTYAVEAQLEVVPSNDPDLDRLIIFLYPIGFGIFDSLEDFANYGINMDV